MLGSCRQEGCQADGMDCEPGDVVGSCEEGCKAECPSRECTSSSGGQDSMLGEACSVGFAFVGAVFWATVVALRSPRGQDHHLHAGVEGFAAESYIGKCSSLARIQPLRSTCPVNIVLATLL
mmetsp:Transcript_70393/g.117572  ORF Transcript_70393/g.117572 Transcript_70393/m.117572 type:complete len:122 (-) Transcript_70393:291-656(-)